MNYRDFEAKRQALVAEYHARIQQHEHLYAPVEAMDAQATRTWTAWEWRFEIAPGNFKANRGEDYVSNIYQFERDRSGMRTTTCWRGSYAMSCVVFLYGEWLAGGIAELPADGALIAALVPRAAYSDATKKQCELMRALLAGS